MNTKEISARTMWITNLQHENHNNHYNERYTSNYVLGWVLTSLMQYLIIKLLLAWVPHSVLDTEEEI